MTNGISTPPLQRISPEGNSGVLDSGKCPWCGCPFEPKKYGPHQKKYCSDRCRNALGSAVRKRGIKEFEAGRLSLEDLKRLPRKSQITSHICEQGWSAIAQWTGTSLLGVLEAAGGVTSEARYVVIDAYGGWYEGYDMFDVVHPQTILAYGMNGKELPLGNGAPVRLRVERHCGYKQLKFIKSIQVVASMEGFGRGTGGLNSDYNFHWYAGA